MEGRCGPARCGKDSQRLGGRAGNERPALRVLVGVFWLLWWLDRKDWTVDLEDALLRGRLGCYVICLRGRLYLTLAEKARHGKNFKEVARHTLLIAGKAGFVGAT